MIGWTRLLLGWNAFRRDRRGVSALEFALIAPVMITAYFGVSELSTAMMTQRRVSHSASALGDLTAQAQSVTSANVDDILAAAAKMMEPMSTTPLKLRLTSITQQSNGKATVDWSVPSVNQTGYAKGTTMSPPPGLLVNTGDSIIMSEAAYTWISPVGYIIPNGIPFSDTFYLRPRYGAPIPCTGC